MEKKEGENILWSKRSFIRNKGTVSGTVTQSTNRIINKEDASKN